ncbi:MAG: polyketide synthase 5, partial [Pseudonocardiales bacterium]|nr:polyketide synthase 5 [Pseudonocardiales bacterium]
EAHGAGTSVGDSIEYASLAKVYGVDGPCALASVKTNFGHTQSAAGALGLMKAVLAVRHGVIPRNLHFTRMPDEFAQIETNLFVPQTNTPWPVENGHQAPRRAAVSSYGFSGTNVHAVLEQAPEATAPEDISAESPTTAPLLFPLSSTSADELRRTAGRLADWVDAHEDVALADLGYTLARRRAHRPVRTAVIASTLPELTEALREVADIDTPRQATVGRDDRRPVWVFSGQGSQWAAMGADLLANEPAFAATVAAAEPLIAHESGFSVTEAMSAPRIVTGIDRIQPTLFTMQVALAATMKAHGVRPGAVIGHSLGEAAAAVVAGALSLEDGVRVSCRRSRLMTHIADAGAMASVELPADQVLSELVARCVDDVVVAMVASPQSTVIGGATETVRDLVAAWERRDVMAREIAVDVASHSPQVEPILEELADVLAGLNPMTPDVPYYSATQFDPREPPVCDGFYWADNLRHTVRFAAAVQAALEDGHRVFAELAPHPLLTHALQQTARCLDMPLSALAGMRRNQALAHGMRDFLAELHNAGAAVDFSVLYPAGRLVDAPLPTWTHRRLFLTRDSEESPTRVGSTVSVHPLLGQHVRLQEEPERHVWQAEVGTAAQPWLSDHQIRNAVVLPGAAYCEMALGAARAVLGEKCEVRDIRFEQELLLDVQTTVGAAASVASPGVVNFAVETDQDGEHVRRAAAVLYAVEDEDRPPAQDVAALLATHPRSVDGVELRKWWDQRGVRLGPAFSGLAAVRIADGTGATVLAEVRLPGSIRSRRSYGVHPALLNACFQSVAAHPSFVDVCNGGLLLPLSVRRLRVYGSTSNARYCYLQVTRAADGEIEADLDALDQHGEVLLTVRGLQMGLGISQSDERDRVLNERLLTIEWQQQALPEVAHTDAGAWLLVSTSTTADALATQLTDALKLNGAQCTSVCWPQHADHSSNREALRSQLRAARFDGLVVLTEPKNGDPDEHIAFRGGEYVR